jgi:putative FmdB family regulatory protein
MPLYEYKCGSCGKTFEVIQKFSDEPLKIHPECGGEVIRLLSAPAFHLKGTGWYATDYKKSNGGSESKAESKTGSKDEAKPKEEPKSGAGDAKPAASGESKPSASA